MPLKGLSEYLEENYGASVFDARNKKGRCFLKSVHEKSRNWKKSGLYEEGRI